jgi:hypothetical protein
MAVQAHKGQRPAQINRTPAPDEVTTIRSPRGGQGAGQNAPQPSVIPVGKGGPQTILGQNLRESVDDPTADAVLKFGTAGRPDQIPADGEDLQLRSVSAKMYPPTHGAARQQDPNFFKAKPSLPASTTADNEGPVRKPS